MPDPNGRLTGRVMDGILFRFCSVLIFCFGLLMPFKSAISFTTVCDNYSRCQGTGECGGACETQCVPDLSCDMDSGCPMCPNGGQGSMPDCLCPEPEEECGNGQYLDRLGNCAECPEPPAGSVGCMAGSLVPVTGGIEVCFIKNAISGKPCIMSDETGTYELTLPCFYDDLTD
jgi:hypothetical protein